MPLNCKRYIMFIIILYTNICIFKICCSPIRILNLNALWQIPMSPFWNNQVSDIWIQTCVGYSYLSLTNTLRLTLNSCLFTLTYSFVKDKAAYCKWTIMVIYIKVGRLPRGVIHVPQTWYYSLGLELSSALYAIWDFQESACLHQLCWLMPFLVLNFSTIRNHDLLHGRQCPLCSRTIAAWSRQL